STTTQRATTATTPTPPSTPTTTTTTDTTTTTTTTTTETTTTTTTSTTETTTTTTTTTSTTTTTICPNQKTQCTGTECGPRVPDGCGGFIPGCPQCEAICDCQCGGPGCTTATSNGEPTRDCHAAVIDLTAQCHTASPNLRCRP